VMGVVVFTMMHMLSFGDDELEDLATLHAYALSLVVDNVPQEVVLLRLSAAKAANNARREDALHNHWIFHRAARTIQYVAFLQGGEITLKARLAAHLLSGLTLHTLQATITIRALQFVIALKVLRGALLHILLAR